MPRRPARTASCARNHRPALFLSTLAAAILLAWVARAAPDTLGRIHPEEAMQRAATGAATLIDIRTPQEWRQTGMAGPAVPITMHDPKGPITFLNNVLAAVGGDKSAPVALICHSGNRSARMRRFLLAQGFTNVMDVRGGTFGRSPADPGWVAQGLPLKPCNC